MGRDRFTHVEWTGNQKGVRGIKDFGFCDHGCKLDSVEERTVYDALKADGWTVHKHGWPDFMATRGNNTRLIEVKSNADRIRQSQLDVHDGLRELGVKVETIIIRNPERKSRIDWKPA